MDRCIAQRISVFVALSSQIWSRIKVTGLVSYMCAARMHEHSKESSSRLNRDVRANERVITKYLAQFERGSVKLQVEAKLLEQLPSGHTSQESIAKALHLSSRSLQRKLKEEGTTYKQLLEDTRRELAAQYVKESELSVGEITFLLGFSEPANFSRAFKRWTGVSPSAYRFL